MNDTPETDELARSLTYEQLASTEKCYSEMRTLARRLERDRDEQCRLLGMSSERECDLRGKLERERALADRLHGVLDALDYNLAFAGNAVHGSIRDKITIMRSIALPAINEWKESRSE